MAKEKYKVQTYEIDFKCDVCGKGWYRPTGIMTLKCNYRDAEIIIREHTYPYTVVEKVEECADSAKN